MTAATAELCALLPEDAFARVPHPGWACCDPAQDLAAWLVAERGAVDELFVESRQHGVNAGRFKREQLRADVNSDEFRAWQDACWGASFAANHTTNEAWRRFSRASKIEAAHQFRLAGRPRLFEPPPPKLIPRRCGRCGTERCEHFPDGAGHYEVLQAPSPIEGTTA